ncbi:MAG: GNAT family N-acetyltransferase [Pseudomonadota bacterium]
MTAKEELLTPARFAQASDATWPGAHVSWAGGWKLRFTDGAGSRAASAWAAEHEQPLDKTALEARIGEVAERYRAAGLRPRFQIWPGDEALDAALEADGWEHYDGSLLMARPANPPPEMSPMDADAVREGREAMAVIVRTPLAILDDVWREGGIGPARRGVLDRSPEPKAYVLGRVGMRPAGAVAMTIHGEVGITQALWVSPDARGAGLGAVLMKTGMRFAAEMGASVVAHAVLEDNATAIGLYERLGYQAFGRYHYRRDPEKGLGA